MVSKGMKWEGPPKNQGSKIHVHPLIWGANSRCFQSILCFQVFHLCSRFCSFSDEPWLPRSVSFFGCFGRGMDPQCAYATTYATGYCNLAGCTAHRKCPLVRFRSFEFFADSFLQIDVMNFTFYMRFISLDSFFFEKVHNQPALTATRLFLEKPPKTGIIKWYSF